MEVNVALKRHLTGFNTNERTHYFGLTGLELGFRRDDGGQTGPHLTQDRRLIRECLEERLRVIQLRSNREEMSRIPKGSLRMIEPSGRKSSESGRIARRCYIFRHSIYASKNAQTREMLDRTLRQLRPLRTRY